jgi:signal transduction histidine kinase
MRWRREIASIGLLLAAWAGLAAWQYHEYGHERQSARDDLLRQTEALMKALVGGPGSNPRLGFLQCERLQEALDQLAASGDVLAAKIVAEDGRAVMTAGAADLLTAAPAETGAFWDEAGLRYAIGFHAGPQHEGGPLGAGGGLGRGRGAGKGWGRAAKAVAPDDLEPLRGGGRFVAMLLVDRSQSDQTIRRAFWTRTGLLASGALVLLCVAVAWRTTVRLAEAHGRARMLEAQARHWRDLGQAAAGLAHETRNPLGLIRGWTQRLVDSGLPSGDQGQQAQAIVEECDRVTSRINQFLAFAKPCEPHPAPVELGPLVEELAVLLEPDLDAKGLKIRRAGEWSARVWADRELLRQALFNLVHNAIQFAPPQGLVEISVAAGQNGSCRIDVADRGPGVAPEKVDSLFTPYFSTRPEGTGLGLAIVRRIAGSHGWEAGYTPRPGGGAVFYLDGIHA